MSGNLSPSRRRLRRARAEGDVAMSPDLLALSALVGGGAVLVAMGPSMVRRLVNVLAGGISAATSWTDGMAAAALSDAATDLAHGVAPAALAAWTAVVGVGLAQTRGLFVAPRVHPWPGFDSPVHGREARVNLRRLATGLLVLAGGAAALWNHRMDLGGAVGLCPESQLWLAGRVVVDAGVLVVALVAVPVAWGLWVEHRDRLQRLAQTPAEQREERRAAEGDPAVRRAIRRRAAGDIDEDDWSDVWCLVKGPGPVAVAVRFRPGEQTLPRVFRVGRGAAVGRLVRRARALRLPVAADAVLARGLARVPVDAVVPQSLRPRLATAMRPPSRAPS